MEIDAKGSYLTHKFTQLSLCLNKFSSIAHQIWLEKDTFFKIHYQFFPCLVTKKRGETKFLSSTQHFSIKSENPVHPNIFATRPSDNSEFIISKSERFEKYSKDYLGTLTTNFWGTGFDIWDYGV